MRFQRFGPRLYWDPFPPTLLSFDVSVTPSEIEPFGHVVSVYLGVWRLRFRLAVWRNSKP